MGKTTIILIGGGAALFAAMLVFAWFHERAVPHINLLISAIGFVVLPLLIWQFGSVRADEKREKTAREITLNLVLLDIEYLSKNLASLKDQLERILGDFDRFKHNYAKMSCESADLNEFNLILASTRTLPKFKYEFGFSKKDLQIFSQDDFKMFDLVFRLWNSANELNENLASVNKNFKNALDQTDRKTTNDEDLYERYAFVNDSYKGVFSDILANTRAMLQKIDEEVLPSILKYALKNFEADLVEYYRRVAERVRESMEK